MTHADDQDDADAGRADMTALLHELARHRMARR